MEKIYSVEDAQKELDRLRALNKSVDMTRGRPSEVQLDIAVPMLKGDYAFKYVGGDARNYGDIKGVPQMRALFAELFGVDVNMVAALDGSSLSIMYELISQAENFGILGGTPWNKLDRVAFFCPSPGYDRHFAICEAFGIEMIPVPMTADGPDMDMIEELVSSDSAVKGVWCVPKYSNPTGAIYSPKTVERFAALRPAANDFRVFWDNAYLMHGLYGEDSLTNIFDLLPKYQNEDLVYEISSTSKITFAGSGVAAIATSEKNMADFISKLQFRIINPNKVNQVMHAAYLKDADGVRAIMRRHADILRPKFQLVLNRLDEEFADDDRVDWSRPRGGYFVSLDVRGAAKQVVELAKSAGVKFTAAGATYPYGKDPSNSNIRIAPSVPSLEDLDFAMKVLTLSIKIALGR